MKKKLLCIMLVLLLTFSFIPTVFAEPNCVGATAVRFGTYTHTDELADGEGLTGYDKEDMDGNTATSDYIRVVQSGLNATVEYISPYTKNGLVYELESFYYKASNYVFLVTFDTPLKLGECGTFVLGLAPHEQQGTFQPDISHIATFNQNFVPPTTVIEYKSETGWALGAYKLNELRGIASNKWGWYMPAETGTFDIYAGAGQNDLTKGTLVGTVKVSIVGTKYVAEYQAIGQNIIDNMHFGVYNTEKLLATTGGAPGKLTNNVTVGTNQYMLIHFDVRVATVVPVVSIVLE
jgi:hypothetical protein